MKQWLQSLLQRNPLSSGLYPNNISDIRKFISDCVKSQIIDQDTRNMIDGVLKISTHQVRDIMVPRAQMVTINSNQSLTDILAIIMKSHHSRFPVVGENRDEIRGIVIARDLLLALSKADTTEFQLSDYLIPADFVPESKRIDNLLEDFQRKHHHMAMVVDEYGGIAGLATIEDVLEEIVGEIEDEHYVEDSQEMIVECGDNKYTVNGLTTIEQCSQIIGPHFHDAYLDTIGGHVARHFGTIPKVGDVVTIGQVQYRIEQVDDRRIRQMKMTVPPTTTNDTP